MCTERLLLEVARHLNRPERVNVFFEDGHANVSSAILRTKDIKSDTEPIEWPHLEDASYHEGNGGPEEQMRVSAMRIGEYRTVQKTELFRPKRQSISPTLRNADAER